VKTSGLSEKDAQACNRWEKGTPVANEKWLLKWCVGVWEIRLKTTKDTSETK